MSLKPDAGPTLNPDRQLANLGSVDTTIDFPSCDPCLANFASWCSIRCGHLPCRSKGFYETSRN